MQIVSTPKFNLLEAVGMSLENAAGNVADLTKDGRIWFDSTANIIKFSDGGAAFGLSVFDAANGLTNNSGDVELGGTLTKATTITGNGQALNITGLSFLNLTQTGAASANAAIAMAAQTVSFFSQFDTDRDVLMLAQATGSVSNGFLKSKIDNDPTYGLKEVSFVANLSSSFEAARLSGSWELPTQKTGYVAVWRDLTGAVVNASVTAPDGVYIGLYNSIQASKIVMALPGIGSGDIGKRLVISAADGEIEAGYGTQFPQTFLYHETEDWAGSGTVPLFKVTAAMAGRAITSGEVELQTGNEPAGGAATFRIVNQSGTIYTSANGSIAAAATSSGALSFAATTLVEGDWIFLEHISTPSTPPTGGNIVLTV